MLLSYSRKELSGLSSLRILLAIYLVMFHTVPFYKGLPDWVCEIVSSGYMATSLFFLLSGFILSHVYLSGEGLRVAPGDFLRTRFLTLYPIHLIGLALSGLILLVQWRLTGSVRAVADIPDALAGLAQDALLVELGESALAATLASHVLMLHAWNPFFQAFNIPSWSVSALVFFYAVFVWVGPWLVNVRRPMAMLLLLNALYLLPPLWFVWLGQYNSVVTGFLHTNPLIRLPEFLSGIVLYRLARRINCIRIALFRFWLLLACSLAFLFWLDDAIKTLGPAGYYVSHNGGLLLTQCFILVLFAGLGKFQTAWLQDAVKRLGDASLSMFILHLPLFFVLTRIEKFIHFLMVGDWHQAWWPQIKAINPDFALYPLMLVIVLLISVWCQERLVIKLRNTLSKRLKGGAGKRLSAA